MDLVKFSRVLRKGMSVRVGLNEICKSCLTKWASMTVSKPVASFDASTVTSKMESL